MLLWIAVIATAAGTYMMRLVPLLWMKRRLKKHSDKNAIEVIPQWLSILGPLMIAAMLGVSMMPTKAADVYSWLVTLIGCGATLITWKYTRSLGIPVLVGIGAFGLFSLIL